MDSRIDDFDSDYLDAYGPDYVDPIFTNSIGEEYDWVQNLRDCCIVVEGGKKETLNECYERLYHEGGLLNVSIMLEISIASANKYRELLGIESLGRAVGRMHSKKRTVNYREQLDKMMEAAGGDVNKIVTAMGIQNRDGVRMNPLYTPEEENIAEGYVY